MTMPQTLAQPARRVEDRPDGEINRLGALRPISERPRRRKGVPLWSLVALAEFEVCLRALH